MVWTLRPYQQQAVDNTIAHFRKSADSAVIVLPTGAGKSLVIAELARLAKHKILVLTHVKELVEQNYQKFIATGASAAVFAAGLNKKQLDQQVVFASVQSIVRNLAMLSDYYSLLIIDECHRVDTASESQYQKVITQLQSQNAQLKVLGLTATPYRLGQGWIYYQHYHGYYRHQSDGFFKHCIFELPLRWMVEHRYLTPIVMIDAVLAQYDFSALAISELDFFDEKKMADLLQSQQRVTHAIVQQLIEVAKTRAGVMIFAATKAHAEEILSYLPQEQAALVVSGTKAAERDRIITQFKAQQIKFLVNVSVLTTGFDAPHVDVIAILRPTKSVSLFQQMVGRGMRLNEGKKDCLVFDFAANGFDLYHPEPGLVRPDSNSVPVQVFCPDCGFANTFWGKLDAEQRVIEHYGRRCQGQFEAIDDESDQPCEHRFVFRQCEACGCENDIAARQCRQCQFKMIDPDDQLKKILKLKQHLALRVSYVDYQIDAAANRVTICYFDEEGTCLREGLFFDNKKHRQWFNQQVVARIKAERAPQSINSLHDFQLWQSKLPRPDFVIAKQADKPRKKSDKTAFTIIARIFDYQGRYRTADSAD